jgi:hypothetical protein
LGDLDDAGKMTSETERATIAYLGDDDDERKVKRMTKERNKENMKDIV